MKTKIWRHILGLLFAVLFSICTVGALATGWDLPAVSFSQLWIACLLFSAVVVLLCYFRYGVLVSLAATGFFALQLCRDGALQEQIQSLAYTISHHYRLVYNWPVIGSEQAASYMRILLLLGAVTALAVSCCICREKTIWIAVPFVFVPLTLSLLTTDTLPDEIWLYGILLGTAVLLITEWVRLRNPAEYPLLVLQTALPTALVLGLLFCLCPQAEYESHAAVLQEKTAGWFEQLKSTVTEAADTGFTGNLAAEKLDLREVGPRRDFSYSVMRVTASFDGIVYLRGRDYDSYTGTGWESTEKRQEIFTSGEGETASVQIRTVTPQKVFYIPYYTAEPILLTDGAADNPENNREYSFSVLPMPLENTTAVPTFFLYTELPEDTRRWATDFLDRMGMDGAAAEETVQAIRSYVRNSASYDLSTAAMDSGHTDFVRWFLEESGTGYCVHFASAAAVLLRAAGIPARYVEGYAVSCTANAEVSVSNRDAHAWVEYYDAEAAVWRILEATPADLTTREPGTAAGDGENEPSGAETGENGMEETGTETGTNEVPQPENPTGSGTEENSTSDSSGDLTDTGGDPVVDGPKEKNSVPAWLRTALGNVVNLFLIICVIPVQAYFRRGWKEKYWNRGDANGMALYRWRQCRYMARLRKLRMPAELEDLALRARFSQHTITEAELACFDRFRQQIREDIQKEVWYRRWLYRWIFVL